ncbi:hypothetical protein KUCAC02_013617 [Chaenocephalus aceratus]|uniref:Uncharacterized protein n=1 Tax=Chaenocephalus aceratus TaxID=36190 RepID=A0ACB9WD50_CHAAC|nr:hypothetical protein KUCAC02_013617 [Chaenocephalus aceratus]
MPLKIDGLTGSCVKVPYTFSLDSTFDGDLDGFCKAIWTRGSMFRTIVFDSGLTGDQASGNLTGKLLNKECTTIFYNLQPSHSDNYYFRIEFTGLTYHNSTYTGGRRGGSGDVELHGCSSVSHPSPRSDLDPQDR